jgi:hypothetical protein
MNEIVRKAGEKAVRTNGVSMDLLMAMQEGGFGFKLAQLCSALPSGCYLEDEHLRSWIAQGEVALASSEFQSLIAELKAACVPATIADIKRELGILFLAFPTRDDLSAFVEIAVAEIATERASRLTLAAACRKLRRTARFRPSISEILEMLSNTSETLRCRIGELSKLAERVEIARQWLSARNLKQEMMLGRHERRQAERAAGGSP